MDHTSPDSFIKLNNFRGSNLNGQKFIWEPLFHDLDTDQKIMINVIDGTSEGILSYEKDKNYLPGNINGIPDDIIAQFRASTRENYSLLFQYRLNDYTESGHFFSNGDSILRQVDTNLSGNEIIQMPTTQFINPTYARIMDTVIDSIGNLELSGKKDIIIEILQQLDPEIEDIVTISRNNVTQLHIRVGNKWLPLQYAGDGVMMILHICLAILERKNGILLVDELESGFHYSMYGKLWKIIESISKQTNCQVIATTHSYELISSVQNNLSDPDNFMYYRLGKEEKETKTYGFGFRNLISSINSDLEVR